MDETERKFIASQKEIALSVVLRTYRCASVCGLRIPEELKPIVDFAEAMDKDKTSSEGDLLDLIKKQKKLIKAVDKWVEKNKGVIVPEETLKDFAKQFYEGMKKMMSDPTSASYDMHDYNSQKFLSMVNEHTSKTFFDELMRLMETDPNCPFFLKKMFKGLIVLAKESPPRTFTLEDERMAEDIMRQIDPNLEEVKPEIFRAMVDSLKWRGTTNLEKTMKAVQQTPPERRKIRGRESCIFIESDTGVHYVG